MTIFSTKGQANEQQGGDGSHQPGHICWTSFDQILSNDLNKKSLEI